MTKANPPVLVICDPADGYRPARDDEAVCVARWASDGPGHLAAQLCGRPATRELAGIDLCIHHWRKAVDFHHEHWACLAYDESQARARRSEAFRRDREQSERCAARGEILKDRAVVYYAQRADGMIKIGTTVHFKARMKALTNEHGELEILLTSPGSMDEETEMHDRFADLAIGHEWFRPGEALLSWIAGGGDAAAPAAADMRPLLCDPAGRGVRGYARYANGAVPGHRLERQRGRGAGPEPLGDPGGA
jgi:hypothetical protein